MKCHICILLFFSSFFSSLCAYEFISENQVEQMQNEYGDRAAQRLKNWDKVMKNAKAQEEQIKVRNINAYFNNYQYRKDQYNWKAIEYWASFGEFIGKGTGDCEDYALAKYYSLRKLGVPASKLKLMSGKFLGRGHLILTYTKEGKEPLVLDNNSRYLGRLSKTYRFKAETFFNEKEYGVMKEGISIKRAQFEYQYFFAWISKNAVNLSW